MPVRYEYVGEWGGKGTGDGEFEYLADVAVGPDGTTYAADYFNDRVQLFTPTGSFLGSWLGWPPGSFPGAWDVAVAPSGVVYIPDDIYDRVLYFSAAGEYLGAWGTEGSGEGELRSPNGVAVGPDGRVYVADAGNCRVQYFTATGEYLGQWRAEGAGLTYGEELRHLAVGPDGRVYVTDKSNNCVRFYTPEGEYAGRWGSAGDGGGEFYSPKAIAVARDGTVYVADFGNCRIQRFTADGEFLGGWGERGYGEGQFNCPEDVAVTADGAVIVAAGRNLELQFFSGGGEFLYSWNAIPSDAFRPASSSYAVAAGPNGEIYVVEMASGNIRFYTAEGDFVGESSDQWTRERRFVGPHGLAVTAEGVVCINAAGRHVQYFTPAGGYIGGWFSDYNLGDGNDVAVGLRGDVYLTDVISDRVLRFSPSGEVITTWGSHGVGDGEFWGIGRLAVGRDGRVYVTDTGNDRVQCFSAAGDLLGKLGTRGDADGRFDSPRAIAIGPEGNVFVVDEGREMGAARVQYFEADGELLGQYFFRGYDGELLTSVDLLAVSADGIVYVAAGSGRIQYFRPVYEE